MSATCTVTKSNNKIANYVIPQESSVKSKTAQSERIQNKLDLKNQENLLPLNFFHSPGQYHKIVIQNTVKETKDFASKMMFTKNLQFMNQQHFEKQQQKKSERIKKYLEKKQKDQKTKRKEKNNQKGPCTCCCCDQFCKICGASSKCTQQKFSPEEQIIDKIQKKLQTLQIQKKRKRTFSTIQRARSAENLGNKKIPKYKNYLKNHKKQNIEALIQTSLKQFNNERLVPKKDPIDQKRKKREKMLIYAQIVKQTHLQQAYESQLIDNSQSQYSQKRKSTEKTKKEKEKQYWEKVRGLIANELIKDKMHKNNKKATENKHINKSKFSIQEIEKLKTKYYKQAVKQIRLKNQIDHQNKIKIKKSLQKLNRKRVKNLDKCGKKTFHPTQSMQLQAFTNLIQ